MHDIKNLKRPYIYIYIAHYYSVSKLFFVAQHFESILQQTVLSASDMIDKDEIV